jgi:hypothetical protein
MMSHAGGRVVPALVVLAVAVVGVLGPDEGRSVAQAAPGPNQVLVVNPASGPVQSAIVGPVTATVANTTAIPVAIDGTPSVALSGPVTIGNTAAEAIPVRDVAVRRPWVGGGQMTIAPGASFASEQFFAAPLGQVLVLEGYSVVASVPAGQVAYQATALASVDGQGVHFRFPLAPMLPDDAAAFDSFATAQHTALNVTEGLVVAVSRNSTAGTGIVDVALSGYLVDAN